MDATHSRMISVLGGYLALKRRAVDITGRDSDVEGREEARDKGIGVGCHRTWLPSFLLCSGAEPLGTFVISSFLVLKMEFAVPTLQGCCEALKSRRATRLTLDQGCQP